MSLTDALGLIGTVVDQKYKVEAVVGEGGFSVVYRAEHIIWKQPVALKCFSALARRSVGWRTSFTPHLPPDLRALDLYSNGTN